MRQPDLPSFALLSRSGVCTDMLIYRTMKIYGRPVQIMYNPDLLSDDSIFHVDEDIAQYFNKYRFKVLTNDQFKKIKETFSKPKIEFLGPPSVNEVIMASKSVRNNTGLLKGDSSLSKIQERLTYSTFPLLDLMQKVRSDDQLTKEEI